LRLTRIIAGILVVNLRLFKKEPDMLPIKRVVLFKHGVGYFQE
jgi:hypothetical protein